MLKTRIHSPAPLEQAALVKSTLKYLPIKETFRLASVSKIWASAQENITTLYPPEFLLTRGSIEGEFTLYKSFFDKVELPNEIFHKIAPLVRRISLQACYDFKIFDFSKLANVREATLWSTGNENLQNPSSYHLMKQVEELELMSFKFSLPESQWPKVWYVCASCSRLSLDVTKFAPSIKALKLDYFPDRNLIISPQIKALWIANVVNSNDPTYFQFTADVQSIEIFVVGVCFLLKDMTFCWEEDEHLMSDKEKEEVVREIPQFQPIQKKIDEMAGLKILIVIADCSFKKVPESVRFFDTSSATEEMRVYDFNTKDLKKILDDME